MKKIIAICMAALLLLAALPVSLVLADGAIEISGSADKTAACAGQEFTLTVSMANNPGLVGWNVQAIFDESAFELTGINFGTAFPASGLSKGPLKSPASVTFADFIAETDYVANGVLYTANFKVKADAADGVYEIALATKDNDLANFSDLAWSEFAVNFGKVAITVGHSYDNACDATCNACGASRDVAGHNTNAAYACQAGKCTECGADVAASAAHTYANACDADCDVCGETRTAGAHVYTNECDADCNECGETRVAPHKYTYACDAHCAICGELTNAEAAHKVGKVEAHEPDCHRDGNVEYWTCAYCGNVWLDEAMTQVSNKKSVVIPAKGGEVKHIEAKAATVDAEGNIEYWFCETCEQFWADEALTQLTNSKNVILPKLEPAPTQPDDTQAPTKPMGENVAVILVSGLIALIAAAAVVLFSKKKA